jgi:ribosomal-protein-alanine N-acetyltransferase
MAFLRTPLDAATTLYGRGVVLRPPQPIDYAAWAQLREASRRHLSPWEPQWSIDETTRAAYCRRLRQYADDLASDGGYAFFAFRMKDMALAGGITLSNVRRGVAQAASVGYWIGQSFAGRGHMTDAMQTLVPYAFDHLRLHRLEAACLPHNAASIRVLEKVGFKPEGLARRYLKIDGRWQDHLLFALIEDDLAREVR